MALRGPNPDDLRKLAAEATQIVNQKFLITTAAITVFGLISTQVVSNQFMADAAAGRAMHGGLRSPDALGWPAFFGSILLNLILLVLWFYSAILAGMLRVITTYLLETGASAWEIDWAAYRRLGHLGYTRAQALVFSFLSAAAAAYPFAFAVLRDCRVAPHGALAVHVAVSALTLASIACLGFLGWPDLESHPDKKWRALRDGPSAGPDPAAMLEPALAAMPNSRHP